MGCWLFGYHPHSGYGSADLAAIHRPRRRGRRLPAARCCSADPAVWVPRSQGQHCRLFVLPVQGDMGDSEVPFGSCLPGCLQPGISVFNDTPRKRLLFVLHESAPAGPHCCWEGVGCVQRGTERVRVGLGSPLSAPFRPRCLLPWAARLLCLACHPACFICQSGMRQVPLLISLGLREPGTRLSSLRQRVGAGASGPSPTSPPAPAPSHLPAVPLGTHPAP